MQRIPCPSDYRSGDELNPGSPYYEEPAIEEGSEKVEFAWFVQFEPDHPKFGCEAEVLMQGIARFEDIQEPALRGRRLPRSEDEVDMPEPRREYLGFDFVSATMPDGRALDQNALDKEPGMMQSICAQLEYYKAEVDEALQIAVESPLKNKLLIKALREKWQAGASPIATPTPKA